jgi:hypothetical protein
MRNLMDYPCVRLSGAQRANKLEGRCAAYRAASRRLHDGRREPKAGGAVKTRSDTIGFSGAVSGLSAHFTAGSSQLMHWRSVRPEMVTTGTNRFPHFGQLIVPSTRSSRFFNPNQKLKLLCHIGPQCLQDAAGQV